MKRAILLAALALVMATVTIAVAVSVRGTTPTQEKPRLESPRDKLSYAMGMDLGGQLKMNAVDIDPKLFAAGLQDALAGTKTLLTEDEAKAAIAELQMKMIAKAAAEGKVAGAKNKAEGEKFLAENKARDGVVTLPSGVQYKILTRGTGPTPKLDQTVTCHYRGTLIDGTEFDSSYKKGQPATFPVKNVIQGWTEVLQLMPVGSKWQVVVPPSLAYGERGAGASIGPNATLVFEIELLAVK